MSSVCIYTLSQIRKSPTLFRSNRVLNRLETFELFVQFWLGIHSYPRRLTVFGWLSRLPAHVDFLISVFSFSLRECTRGLHSEAVIDCNARLPDVRMWGVSSCQI